jgi:ABC-type sugar transport system substrate-binding protein
MSTKNVRPAGARSRRAAALAAVVTIGIAVLTACSATPTPTATPSVGAPVHKAIRLGFSPLSLDVPALQDTANALTAAGKGSGITVTVADPKFNPQTQITQVMQWIQLKQVDAIWIIPVAPPALAPVIAAAKQAHIALLLDTSPQAVGLKGPGVGVSFAGTDYAAFGADMGKLTAQCISSRLGGNGKIIYEKDSTGQFGSPATDAALNAALASGSPNSAIVSTISPVGQLPSQQQTASALQAEPNANTAVGTNDEAVLGALAAFQQAGKNPSKSCIVGGGGGAQAVAAIKAGTIYGGVVFDYKTDTENNVKAIVTMVTQPTSAGVSLHIPIIVVKPAKK